MQTLIDAFKAKEKALVGQVIQARERLQPFEPSGELKRDYERVSTLHDALLRYSDVLTDLLRLYGDVTQSISETPNHPQALEVKAHAKRQFNNTLAITHVVYPQLDAAWRLNKACMLMRSSNFLASARMVGVLDLGDRIQMQLGMAHQDLERANLQDYGFVNSRVLESIGAHYWTVQHAQNNEYRPQSMIRMSPSAA